MIPSDDERVLIEGLEADGRRVEPELRDALTQRAARLVASAREFWGFDVDRSDFLRALATCARGQDDLVNGLEQVNATDLYLATGCARGESAALAAFERNHGAEIDLAVRKSRRGAEADDLGQEIRSKLLVGGASGPPAIARYRGNGKLRGWLRMTVVRMLIDDSRVIGHRREESTEDDVLDAMLEPEQDPELSYLKQHYRSEFSECVSRALDLLGPKDRTLLKYRFADGLGIDGIGKVYGVHRATAARWLAKARQTFLELASQQLARKFAVGAPEFQSILRLVRSRIDIDFSASEEPEG